ncbi:MAG: hypothetical protein ACM3JJ_07630 [Hyphomicrobiales bacterium]
MERLAIHSDRIARRGALLLLLAAAAFGCSPRGEGVVTQGVVLDICGVRRIVNPTDEQIRTELGNLSTKNVDSFAIMGTSEMTYIQVGGDKTVGFTLEYQEGSVDAHYQTTSRNIPLGPVVRAFIEYRDGKVGWEKEFTFKRITW